MADAPTVEEGQSSATPLIDTLGGLSGDDRLRGWFAAWLRSATPAEFLQLSREIGIAIVQAGRQSDLRRIMELQRAIDICWTEWLIRAEEMDWEL